jgi:hypothetical protein
MATGIAALMMNIHRAGGIFEPSSKAVDPISRPNVFAVLLDREPDETKLSSINLSLANHGISIGGSTPIREGSASDGAAGVLCVYFTYLLAAEEHILDRRRAMLLNHVARIFRRQGVPGRLLTSRHLSQLLALPEIGQLFATARQGDRDLDLGNEILVRDLSRNRARSSVWVVRRNGKHLVRKAYSSAHSEYVEREILAREALRDPRVLQICERHGNVLYLPYVEGDEAWSGRFFAFCPRPRAAAIFDFLGHVARSGYAMIDIGPSAFLFDARDRLAVVDFEFFASTPAAPDFALSKDYAGVFDGLPTPAKNGYRRYWYDAIGGELATVMAASPAWYAVGKALHVLTYRMPRRTLSAAEKLARQLRAHAIRLLGLRRGYFWI